ncbi:MAG TPA: Clp protease N-terminal domain-containing protein [Acidimicrobiales bacterium]|nr:Clp protease N-terminal domain-containing protein [Acidimicrobiales bacterium]
MSERLSARVRAVLVLAQQESRRLGHEAVAPEHLLAALIAEGRGIAARALSSLGVRIDAVRGESQAAYGRVEHGAGKTPGKQLAAPNTLHVVGAAPLPYSETAKRVLEQAAAESEALSDAVVGTEHVLLAFTGDAGSGPARLLDRLGQDLVAVRQRVLDLRAARRGPGEPLEAPKPPSVPAQASRNAPPGGRDGASARADSARRAARASTRAYEPGGRGRWAVERFAGSPPSRLVTPPGAGPRCPGCGGTLEHNLAARHLVVEDVDPRPVRRAGAGSDGAGSAGAEPAGAAPGGAERAGTGPSGGTTPGEEAAQGGLGRGGDAVSLRIIFCSACGQVLHAEPGESGLHR